MNKNKNDSDGVGSPNHQRQRRKSSRLFNLSTVNWASVLSLVEEEDADTGTATLSDNGNTNKNDSDGAGPPNRQRPRRKSRFLNLSTVNWYSTQDLADEDDASIGSIATLGDKSQDKSQDILYFDSKRKLRVGDANVTEPTSAVGTPRDICMRALQVLLVIACILGGASVVIRGLVIAQQNNDARHEPQRLLEIAEQVVWACGESQLDSDPSKCSDLCEEYMCCFEGEGSCADDETKDCAVYTGCEALVTEVVTEERVVSACSEPNLSADVYGCIELCDGNLCCIIEGEGSCANDENKDCAVYDGCRALVPNHTIERHWL